MVVDVHTHIFPPEVVERRERFLDQEPAFAAIYSDPAAPMVTAEGLLAAMERDGVSLSWALGFPWRQAKHARLHNDYLAACQKDFGGRLLGLGCVAPGEPWALAEAERCLSLGLRGLGELAFYDRDLDLAALGPLCRLAAEAGAPLLLHTNEPVGHRYAGKAPMTLAALYELIQSHQATKLVLAHLGAGIFFYSLLKKEVARALQNVWLDTAAVPFLYQPRVIGLANQLLGPGKLLMGSDFPLLRVERCRQELDPAQSGLSQADFELVMGRAALELLPAVP